MYSLQTNIGSLNALEQGRLNQKLITHSTRALSGGIRIYNGAVDPSGLGIAQGMRAQLGGLHTASENIQDGIRMIHTADATLGTMQNVLMRIRDLATRGANQATLTDRDMNIINNEVKTLADELTRMIKTSDYNTKQLFQDAYADNVAANGEYNVTEDAALAGTAAYEAFKQKIKDMLPEAMDQVFEYLGAQTALDLKNTVIDLDFSYAGPALATGAGFSPTHLAIQFNTALMMPMSDFAIGRVLAHEMTHAITAAEGVNGFDATNWKDEMLAQFVSQEVDSRIPDAGLPAEIAGALNANVGLANAAYARVALAGQYIYETYGADKWVDVVDYIATNGGTYDGNGGAIVSVLGYANWAAFEADVDAYSTAANNNGSVPIDPPNYYSAYGSRQMRFNLMDLLQVDSEPAKKGSGTTTMTSRPNT
jgi:hypothetical protein